MKKHDFEYGWSLMTCEAKDQDGRDFLLGYIGFSPLGVWRVYDRFGKRLVANIGCFQWYGRCVYIVGVASVKYQTFQAALRAAFCK